MANRLKVQEQEAILNLKRRGWTIRRIARELGVSRNTVRGYLRNVASTPVNRATVSARASAVQTDPLSTTGCAEQSNQTDPLSTAGNQGRKSLCVELGTQIREKFEAGLTAQRIYQDLKAEMGFPGSYESVKRYVAKLRQTDPSVVQRIEVQPGEEVQVDFGSGPTLKGADGKERRTWIFRMVLSHSRKGYCEAVLRQDTETFIRCLENAFRAFGGSSLTINLDNLKAAVLKADWADPELNPKLADFARHYGTTILPCLPKTPEHKGKIESGIKYIKGNALAGRKFCSLAELNLHLADWERTVADQRIHGTTKRQVAELFKVEQPALVPLPATLFPCFKEGPRSVHRDGHIEVEKAFYHVPPEYLRQEVWARYDSREVRIFAKPPGGTLKHIQTHRRLEPGQFTNPRGIGGGAGSLQANLDYWQKRASNLGSSCQQWAEVLVRNRGVESMRSLMGLVSLVERHSFAAVNRACERALAKGALRLRDVRALLQSREIQTQIPFEEHHPLIRKLSEYGVFIRAQNQNP
jgi:transposase